MQAARLRPAALATDLQGVGFRAAMGQSVGGVALAFGGYAPKNLGRTAELLSHPAYSSIVRRYLVVGADMCSEALSRRVDLLARVTQGSDIALADYGEALTLIVSTQLAQLQILREIHGFDHRSASFSFGFSLGEVTALISSGVYSPENVLPPLLSFADECVSLAEGVDVGLLIFRNTARIAKTEALCAAISAEEHGRIAVSAHLSPNVVMLIGQNGTFAGFSQRMAQAVDPDARLRRLPHCWPPLHTPLMHQHDVAARVAEKLANSVPSDKRPSPPVLSLVTGDFCYDRGNTRDTLVQWVTRPQRLSDAICKALASGVQTIVHVGPRPEPIRSTFAHLSREVADGSVRRFGAGALRRLAQHPQLARMLFARAALFRAPYVSQVVLEDWLLDNVPKNRL